MKIKMYAILEKAKPHTENLKGLNLVAAICMAVQVFRLLWYFDLIVTSRA
jgi:hypothetical protein